MAKLRKFSAYQRLERPYTRKSKFKSKDYIGAAPAVRVVSFDMGNDRKKFAINYTLNAKKDIQIRQNSIESARLAANRHLERNLGKDGFKLKIRIYPHHILRENPLAAGAGADRMSTGMKRSFGKPISVAAQVRKGQIIFQVGVDKANEVVGKRALQKASYKLPCACKVILI